MNAERNIHSSGENGCSGDISIRIGSHLSRISHARGGCGDRRYVAPLEEAMWERRETRYITRALASVPRGTSVLNWPCERGRLLPALKRLGYGVMCVDSSSHTVAQARFYGGLVGEGCIDDTDDFRVGHILEAGFDCNCFGAVVVNHLFCHFPESQMRKQVLKELGRICSGPIVVSFFHIAAPENTVRSGHDGSSEYRMQDHIAVNRRSFAEEVSECGLIVDKWVPKYSFISKQGCAVLIRDKVAVRPSHLP